MSERRNAIDTTPALLRAASGLPTDFGHLEGKLQAPETWQQVIAFASAHLVLPSIHQGIEAVGIRAQIPDDAADFLAQVHQANAQRNTEMLECLANLAKDFNSIDVVPTVLKGGAFLLDDCANKSAWRFMADLDLLVPQAALDTCVASCLEHGFGLTKEEYDPARHAHFPPLISPCETYSVELHTRLFGRRQCGLEPEIIDAGGERFTLTSAKLKRPSSLHRIVHLIAHSQLHHRYFALNRVLFRDLLDLSALADHPDRNWPWSEVLAHFDRAEDQRAAKGHLALWHIAFGAEFEDVVGEDDIGWANRAMERPDMQAWRRSALMIVDTVKLEASRLAHEGDACARIQSALRDPSRLTNWVSRRRDRMRQENWS